MDRGALLAASCSSCHAVGAEGPAQLPRLDILTAEEIAASVKAFRADENATLMNRIARGFSDYEIDVIASYLASKSQETP